MDGLFYLVRYRTRTHLNATCQWHVAATSSKTGGILTICSIGTNWQSSPISSTSLAKFHDPGSRHFRAANGRPYKITEKQPFTKPLPVRRTVAEIRLDGFHSIHFRKAEMAIESYIVLIQPHSISSLNIFRPGSTQYPLFCQPPCNFRCCYSAYIAHSSNVITI